VRELTKALDGATNAHWKSLIRTIKFVLDTRLYDLRLLPFTRNGSLFLHGYSDSEFAGDRRTHKSGFGFITFLCGAPLSWKSKACHSVTLSSTEAEYYAGSETAKEMIFIKRLLERKTGYICRCYFVWITLVPSIYQTIKLLDKEPNILTSALTMSVT
jgi:hypothetical protein